MQASSPLETLLHELLSQELHRRGAPLSAQAEQRARAELERCLRARQGPTDGPYWRGIPGAELEQALASAVRAGTHTDESVGQVLDGKYLIEELLAEGGFGKVYRARDRDLDCAVAIKVLKPAEHGSSTRLEAFKQEARRLTRLQHANIVEWKTLNQTADGRLYLVMEYLEGEVLEDTLQREQKLAPARAARILLGVLDALRHAHNLPDGSSLLHLDLKPSNVFLVRGRHGEERVKVLDFGISRFVGQEERAPARSGCDAASLGESTRLPAASAGGADLACTPLYCPPEQPARILGGKPGVLDGRADLYSLGVMGYRMLSGRLPFESAGSFFEMLRLHHEVAAPRIGTVERSVPKKLARFVDRCLRKAPEERFASAQEAHESLRRIVTPARSRLWFGLAAASLVSAALYSALAPSAVRPPLEAVLLEQGERVANQTLVFGPVRPSRTLELVDLAPGTALEHVRLVREPRAGADSPPGWELRPSGDRRVELHASAAPARQVLAFLELADEEGARYSEPFHLRYVDPADWALEAADVAGRAGRSVAPRGQELELLVRGAREILPASAEVRIGAEHYSALRDEARSSATRGIYRLALDGVAWQAGRNRLTLRLEDAAANELVRDVELEIVPTPLAIESCRLAGGTFAAGRWHVLAGEEPVLEVRCTRPAGLAWSVESTSGRVLSSGTSSAGGREHRIPLDGSGWPGGSFAGAIRITADESEWVAHAAESPAGVASAQLDLEVRPTGATFDVSLTGARERGEREHDEPVRYVTAESIEAVVLRDHDIPMVVSARCEPREAADAGVTVELYFDAPQVQRKTAQLALPHDGVHRLVLEARRLDPEGRPFEQPDTRHEVLVVRDTRAPEIVVEPRPQELVLRSRAELARLALALRATDPCWTQDPAPVEVSWSLELRRQGGTTGSSAGRLTLLPGEPCSFAPLLPPEDPAASGPDGVYALRLHARDFAGNVDVDGQEYTWTVSTEAPCLRVLVPLQGEPWARSEQRFTVELRAEDANGVAAVTCELTDPRGELAAVAVALSPSASAGLWAGSFALDHRWAGKNVELRFRGTDAAGTETLEPVVTSCTVGPIPSLVPAHVEISYRQHGATRMRRVPGNQGVAYFFGGRGDSLENSAFRAAGLADFAASSIASSLRIEVPPGALEDFYLDELEVSVGQYLEFLRASDGYADVRQWDTQPEEARRLVLERELATLDPELPVTGVDFDEARACARWAGKEIPTYLHWEYAVRGLAGRPYSFSGLAPDTLASALGSEINVGTRGPWPVTRGSDRTSDTLLVDLCSNVAEWTETPVRGRLSAVRPAELLARGTARAEERLYVAGGSFARAAFHFGAVAREPRTTRSASIGLRCFLPARVVEAAFLRKGDAKGDLRITAVR